ncbi:MAG: SAM-dependent methyltransferase [Tidjanibacter sp.]|nr:SAM-dependent methyltransferase [Tidjanibacter sp.]
MDSTELGILTSPQVREAIEANIERDPSSIALDKRLAHPREVATQVKYLQRARRKLPSYYAARAILPSLAFEQSSSEECAAHKQYGGKLAIDLTCGLGVDTLYLAKRFERVVSIERNPTLAAITRHNLALLGASNVEVICGSAEEFLGGSDFGVADLIYIDPDRRGAEGKKMVCLEECSPNVAELWDTLTQRAQRVVIKLSPMFDLRAALVAFGQEGVDVEVVSLGGECKEVVVDWSAERAKAQAEPMFRATALGGGGGTFEAKANRQPLSPMVGFEGRGYRYLVVPDASLRKAGLVSEWCHSRGLDPWGPYGFTTEEPQLTMGRVYEIEATLPYRPKQLKPLVGKKIELIRHSFPLSSAAICKALGTREGGGDRWAFGEVEHELWAFKLKMEN